MLTKSRITIAKNAIALYAVQFAGYIFPLILTPYLARTLHPDSLGKVAFSQSFAWWCGMVMEFGFTLSASRDVARHLGNREHLSRTFSSVLGAKALLAIPIIISALIARYTLPIFRAEPILLWCALGASLAQGAGTAWFFLGTDRIRYLVKYDLLAKCASLIGVLLTVHGPKDAWKVLIFQGVGYAIPNIGGILMALRQVSLLRPSAHHVRLVLVQSWPIFLVNSIITFYGTANTMILGTVQSAKMVGFYAGSDKAVRPFCNLFIPLSQSLYPRSNALAATNPRQAARLAYRALLFMAGGGLLIGIVVSLCAPIIVHILLGKDFDASIPVIRVLAFLIPLAAAGIALGQQSMFPLGLEKVFVRTVIVSAVVDITVAWLLAPRMGALGQAIAVICAEATTVIGNYVYLTMHGLAPHQWQQRLEHVGESEPA